jgi:hypothetical protein
VPKQSFRVTSIELDPEEEVSAVRVQVTARAYEVITGQLLTGETVKTLDHGNDHRLIELLTPQVTRLHSLTGKFSGDDPLYPVTTEIYDSLCMVVYGLMEE